MTQAITFVQSGTPVTVTPQEASATINMPTYDASNLDVQVSYSGPQPCFLQFTPAVAAGDLKQRGEVQLLGNGVPVLLTNNAATLAAAASNPLVIQNPNAGAATTVSIIAGMRGGTLTIQRGTATPRATF
jgi:hypothetical protein